MNERAYQVGRQRGEGLKAAAPRWGDLVRETAKVAGWPPEKLTHEVVAHDAERLAAVPNLTVYPELRGLRDRIDAEDRGKLEAGASREVIAIDRTFHFFQQFRLRELTGRTCYAEAMPEKCRVLYIPESHVGAIHAKNVDDPAEYFKPHPPEKPGQPWHWRGPLVFDGVGSGLHIDEKPPEIFPVDVRELCQEHCTTVPAATDFMVRYNYFWSSQNLLVHDHAGDSVAFEKTSCRVATIGPDAKGRNYISGMAARDPEIRRIHHEMRDQYLTEIGDTWDGPHGRFWTTCGRTLERMGEYVARLPDNPTVDDVSALMARRDPDGPLCFTGEKQHPAQPCAGWTLVMLVFLMDRHKMLRRQYRDGRPAYLDRVEEVQYA